MFVLVVVVEVWLVRKCTSVVNNRNLQIAIVQLLLVGLFENMCCVGVANVFAQLELGNFQAVPWREWNCFSIF